LKNDFFKKTFLEKYFSEFQTKEMPLRGAENPEQTRGEYFRFERGQILKAYQILRAQISEDEENSEEWKEKKDFLEEIRLQANVWKKN